MTTFTILSIESYTWDYPAGWIWNQSFQLGTIEIPEPITTRRILRTLREYTYLSQYSRGRVRIEEYGEGSFEIQSRKTGKPLFALEPTEN